MNLETRIYQALLKLYPREFRNQYSEEMTRVFRESFERDGSSFGFWARTLTDAFSSAGRERISGGTIMNQIHLARLGAIAIATISLLYFGVGLIPLVITDFSGVYMWFSELVALGTVALFVVAMAGFVFSQPRRPNPIEFVGYALIAVGFVLSMIRLMDGERMLSGFVPIGMIVLGVGRSSQQSGFAFKRLAREGIAMVILASSILTSQILPQPDSRSWQAVHQFVIGTFMLGLAWALWDSSARKSSQAHPPTLT
jgi:hypothetical protein